MIAENLFQMVECTKDHKMMSLFSCLKLRDVADKKLKLGRRPLTSGIPPKYKCLDCKGPIRMNNEPEEIQVKPELVQEEPTKKHPFNCEEHGPHNGAEGRVGVKKNECPQCAERNRLKNYTSTMNKIVNLNFAEYPWFAEFLRKKAKEENTTIQGIIMTQLLTMVPQEVMVDAIRNHMINFTGQNK